MEDPLFNRSAEDLAENLKQDMEQFNGIVGLLVKLSSFV